MLVVDGGCEILTADVPKAADEIDGFVAELSARLAAGPPVALAQPVEHLLDHDDRRVAALLRRIRTALPRGGTLIVAEPMTGVTGARRVGEAYFSFYLRAMGRGAM